MPFRPIRLTAVLATLATTAVAQPRTTQPPLISIDREFEKSGHAAPHAVVEARWADANRKVGNPNTYIALVAASGVPEIWWVTGFDTFEGLGKSLQYGSDNASYTQQIARISLEDGDHISGNSRLQARAMPDAGYGPYPDLSKARVFSVLTVRTRPGFDDAFTEVAKHYAAIAAGGSGVIGWRAYQVIGGAPAGTYLVFSAFPSWAAVGANDEAFGRAIASAAAHMEPVTKLSREAVMSTETRYFTVDPQMSSVGKETMAADPFWAPKPIAGPKKASP
jgi:hypothetical protein